MHVLIVHNPLARGKSHTIIENGLVNIKEIRDYAMTRMAGSVFAAVIAMERDEISDAEFKAKLSVWFALLALEEKED